MAANRSWTNRLQRHGDNRFVFNRTLIQHNDTTPATVEIEGRNVARPIIPHHGDVEGWRTHVFIPLDDGQQLALRTGPMLLAQNITNAFDFYKEALKASLPSCTLAPFRRPLELTIEELHVCTSILLMGEFGAIPAEPQTRAKYYIANAYAVGLPNTMLHPAATANGYARAGMGIMMEQCSDAIKAEWALEYAVEGVAPAWCAAGRYGEAPVAAWPRIIEIAALNISTEARTLMMRNYIDIFLAYTQQGNITQNKLTKITQELGGDQIMYTGTTDEIAALWRTFGPYFDDTAAHAFFPAWGNLFADRNLRMQLTMQQCTQTGLTGLTITRRAHDMYPNFPWDKVCGIVPDQYNLFLAAHRLVGRQNYYGYKKNLADVAIGKYLSVAYTAAQILEHVHGDRNIGNLASLRTRDIPRKVELDRLVRDFVTGAQRAAIDGDRVGPDAYYDLLQVPHERRYTAPLGEAPGPQVDIQAMARLFAQLNPGGAAGGAVGGQP